MAILEIATKANSALLLPSLLITVYFEHNGLLSTVEKSFQAADTLTGKEAVRLTLDDGRTLTGGAIVQYLSQLATSDANSHRVLLDWVTSSDNFALMDFQSLHKSLDELDRHLTLRTYIVGYDLSVADLAVWGTIRGNRITYSSIKKTSNHVLRWYNYIETSFPWVSETVAELNSYASKERAALSAAGASYDIDLPDVKGPMVTRFPPEPSGYLHVGHAKAALLNDYFAHKNRDGTLICRFDDTNPSKESMEFQDAILHDLKLVEIIADKITYSSDYFQEMYEFALKLIKDGKAFADDSELGKGDEDRKNRLPSKRRGLGVKETLEHFAEMKTGSEEGRRWCLRARIAYDSPNGTLRDPVIYRCNLIPHHRTGSQWKLYPTYDFCAPILDSFEGVTIALRTNEYRDRNVQYEWMQHALGLRKVPIWDFSRMNFVRTVLSKRKLTKIVEEGKVWGWDDPRMPTIRGILRRGMAVPPLREFILKQGPSRNVLNLEWGAFWALNKKYIYAEAPRHTAILQEQAVHCRVGGITGPDIVTKPKYVKNLGLGSKKVMYDKAIILEQADAQTFEQDDINKDPESGVIKELHLELHLNGDVKKTKKITWLAATSTNLIPIDLVAFDHLITKDKLEKEDKLEEFLTPVTELRSQAFADCNMTKLPRGAIIQFERKGYYHLDVPYQGEAGSRMVFFDIPTGKT